MNYIIFCVLFVANAFSTVDVNKICSTVSDGSFPFIHHVDYLSALSLKANELHPNSATVIVGPRSAGKSEGLVRMTQEWKREGRTIFEINLKGKQNEVSSASVLDLLGSQIITFITDQDLLTQECVHQQVEETCPEIRFLAQSEQEVGAPENSSSVDEYVSYFRETMKNSWQAIPLIGSAASVVMMAIIYVVRKLLSFFKWLASFSWIQLLIGFFIFVLFLIAIWYAFIYFSNLFGNVLPYWLHCLQKCIRGGNWSSVVCANNAITQCQPQKRPIFIVREISKLDLGSVEELLIALERFKEGGILFPVFLEASSFSWVQNSAIVQSSESFETLFLQEMDRPAGHLQLVDKHNIWSTEEFDKIYDSIGGHMGSLRALFNLNKVQGVDLDKALANLNLRADQEINAVYVTAGDDFTSVEKWLTLLKAHNYVIEVKGSPAELKPWLDANVLFQYGTKVFPQSILMQHAIQRQLELQPSTLESGG